MALFSFRHSVKTFSPKCEKVNRIAAQGQTAAHLRYITRPAAAREVIRQRLDHSTDARQAQAAESEAQRRRGRVCERFIVALPVEASPEQRLELAQAFAETLTKGKAGYILAIHDKAGNDQRNPHFHIVAFDTQEKSGGRGRPRSVLGMARKNAVEMMAEQWADIHNKKMDGWGFGPESNITHRSYDEQGVDRVPEIHEGPASRAMMDRGKKPESKKDSKNIDVGKSRAEANVIIREINQLNQEIENVSGNRLGSADRAHSVQGDSRCPPFGKDSQRSGAMPFGTIGTKESYVSPLKEPSRNHQPPWIAGERAESSTDADTGPQLRKNHRHSTGACERPVGPPVRRSRVRRVFLELIFLRDTLRARLATLGGRRRALPTNQQAEASIKSQKWSRSQKPREAERQ
jgi:hypothetical protein